MLFSLGLLLLNFNLAHAQVSSSVAGDGPTPSISLLTAGLTASTASQSSTPINVRRTHTSITTFPSRISTAITVWYGVEMPTDLAVLALNPGFSSWVHQITNEPQYLSLASVLSTAVPSSFLSDIHNSKFSGSLPVPSWYSALPSDVTEMVSSLRSQETSLISNFAISRISISEGSTISATIVTGTNAFTTLPSFATSTSVATTNSTKTSGGKGTRRPPFKAMGGIMIGVTALLVLIL